MSRATLTAAAARSRPGRLRQAFTCAVLSVQQRRDTERGAHSKRVPERCSWQLLLSDRLFSCTVSDCNMQCLVAGHACLLTPCCLPACSSPVLYRELALSKVLRWVRLGLLDASEVITMKVRHADSSCRAVQAEQC